MILVNKISNTLKKIFSFSLVLYLFFSHNIAVAQVDIGNIKRIADTGELEIRGEIKNIRACPVNPRIVSFETYERGENNKLHWVNFDNQAVKPITINILQKGDDSYDDIVCNDLNWCPVKINNKTWFAFTCIQNKNEDIYIGNTSSDYYARLTIEKDSDRKPRWSPNGKYLLYVSTDSENKGNSDIKVIMNMYGVINDFDKWTKENDSKAEKTTLVYGKSTEVVKVIPVVNTSYQENDPDWSPDGKMVVYTAQLENAGRKNQDLYVINFDMIKEGKITSPTVLTNSLDLNETKPKWSPDGKRIAFFSMPGGSIEEEITTASLYYLVFSDDFSSISPSKVIDNVRKGIQDMPQWGEDSKRLFFIKEDGSKSSVRYLNTDDLENGKKNNEKILFRDSSGISYREFILLKTGKFSRAYFLTMDQQEYVISTTPILIEDNTNEEVRPSVENTKLHWSVGMEMQRDQYIGQAPVKSYGDEAGSTLSIEYLFDQSYIPLNLAGKLSCGFSYLSNDKLPGRIPLVRLEISALLSYDFKFSGINSSVIGELGAGAGSFSKYEIAGTTLKSKSKNTTLSVLGLGLAFYPFDRIKIVPSVKWRFLSDNVDAEKIYSKNDGLLSYQIGFSYMFNLSEVKF